MIRIFLFKPLFLYFFVGLVSSLAILILEIRFAEFVEGSSHLSDREVLDYETTSFMPDSETLTEDESSEE